MVERIIKKVVHKIVSTINYKEENEIRKILSNSNKPIYHFHIRKTAGTAINFSFLMDGDSNGAQGFYDKLAQKFNHRLVKKDKVFVGWNKSLINKGHYSYAFSHTPFHQLKLSKNIFKFTCLREPTDRVISHYNMLMYFKKNKIKHPCMKVEGKWLGNSFSDFISNIPRKTLLNQLYMFSEKLEVEEAVNNILSLDLILFTEDLENGIRSLENKTKCELVISKQKNYGHKEEITESEMKNLEILLKDEIRMFNIIRKNNYNTKM